MKRHIDHLTQCTEQSPVVTDATSEDSTVQDLLLLLLLLLLIGVYMQVA